MENVVHNPAELGEVAEKTRAALGFRQTDLHTYTKLNTRFIGEVEHGKPTAQLGKVMQMLESMGLEMVIRPQVRDIMDAVTVEKNRQAEFEATRTQQVRHLIVNRRIDE